MSLTFLTFKKVNLSAKLVPKSCRPYSISRFPSKSTGVSRLSRQHLRRNKKVSEPGSLFQEYKQDFELQQDIENGQTFLPTGHSDDGLIKIFQENTLIVERQLEMLNVFVGFEQSNKYTICSVNGDQLGYIAEEPRGLLGTISRQILATHRPFTAVVMDQQGIPILWMKRPFSWINSRLSVQRAKPETISSQGQSELDVFGEVQQVWHPWRRRYDLFLREKSDILNDESCRPSGTYYQIAKVDAGFLSWNFDILNERSEVMAHIERAFRGFGREILTDTGKYSVSFKPSATSVRHPVLEGVETSNRVKPSKHEELDIDTKALLLSLAINVDFDYFSRHSHAGGGGGLFGLHTSNWD